MNNKKQRMNIAKAMHEIVCSLNNESWYYNYWISVMPDEPTKEDFEDFGEDEQMFEELCSMFEYIMTCACRTEKPFYIGGKCV